VIGFDMRWRLGYHAAFTSAGILPGGFGHFGFGGSGAWADPESGLAVAMVLNQIGGSPFGDTKMLRIGGAAIRAAKRC
jgi:CubicO group peptidase (beta-lactamase class C family)